MFFNDQVFYIFFFILRHKIMTEWNVLMNAYFELQIAHCCYVIDIHRASTCFSTIDAVND